MTTTQYFKGITTVEAIKRHYRNLARENHPDLGGNVEVMQEINRQYQEALKRCDGTASEEGRTYHYKAEVEQELTNSLLTN
ncbi:MAG: J domain-containing protein [Gammaproteobacteria bacterium]